LSLTQRDAEHDSSPAFVVRDDNYVSARWPGDAYTFARAFEQVLAGTTRELATRR